MVGKMKLKWHNEGFQYTCTYDRYSVAIRETCSGFALRVMDERGLVYHKIARKRAEAIALAVNVLSGKLGQGVDGKTKTPEGEEVG